MRNIYKGACGEPVYIKPDSINFAYPVQIKNDKLIYVGLVGGKKLFLDMDFNEFITQYQDGEK